MLFFVSHFFFCFVGVKTWRRLAPALRSLGPHHFAMTLTLLKKLRILTNRDIDCVSLSFGLAWGRLGQAIYSGTNFADGRMRKEAESLSSELC
jgi:hypothetical protein